MHSSVSLWKCRPRGLSPGCGTAISTSRSVTAREPVSPETISSERRPGRPSSFASAGVTTRAMSARDLEMLDLCRAALRFVQHAEQLGRLLCDRLGDVL